MFQEFVSLIQEEHTIIHGLLSDLEFSARTLVHIKEDHFNEKPSQYIFEIIRLYNEKYNGIPSRDEVKAILGKKEIDTETLDECEAYLEPAGEFSTEFLMDHAEEYCKDRGIMNAIFQAMEIIDGNDKKRTKESIPDLLADAISFRFESDIGLDYYLDIDRRVESYNMEDEKFPFKLSMLNRITNGGVERKTLNLFAAPTNFGKSIFMADEALHQTKRGRNVVYFTFEMSDERIAKRIDANDLDVNINQMPKFKENLRDRFEKQKAEKKGDLIIVEMSPGTVTAQHISQHIKRIEMEKKIKVDIIYLDYLNLMASYRVGAAGGSYTLIKYIAEELVALSKKHDIPVVSVTQFTRGGQENTSPGMSEVSESIGLMYTVDLMVFMFDTEDLRKTDRAIFKQTKNRYGDVNHYRSFTVGVIRGLMRFFDVDERESDELIDNIKESKPADASKIVEAKKKFRNFGEKLEL